MLRKLCNKSGVHAIVCQGNSHVGFAAAVGGAKAVGLNETVVALGSETEHDLTKCNNFLCHDKILLYF